MMREGLETPLRGVRGVRSRRERRHLENGHRPAELGEELTNDFSGRNLKCPERIDQNHNEMPLPSHLNGY